MRLALDMANKIGGEKKVDYVNTHGTSTPVGGVQEAIYSLLMAERGFIAESANIENLVDEADGMNILTERQDKTPLRIMSNSFGFGGTNACLIFDKWTQN